MYPEINSINYILLLWATRKQHLIKGTNDEHVPSVRKCPICLHDWMSCRSIMTSTVVMRHDLVKQATKASPKGKTIAGFNSILSLPSWSHSHAKSQHLAISSLNCFLAFHICVSQLCSSSCLTKSGEEATCQVKCNLMRGQLLIITAQLF